MTEKRFKRVIRPATAEERQRHAQIRREVMQEFPPAEECAVQEAPPGIPSQIRQARQAQGLTWYALAERAGVPSADTIRDIEYGRDSPLSTVAMVAKALGLRLELVAEQASAEPLSS
jgi:DNA-binding XRE family transcriptional regulator